MKVKIKDLKPNPFRDIKNYPINPEKIESLKKSINQTGFWDNILARKKDGKIEIAYGHHRLKVLQELFKPDDEVDIPVKDLDDAMMIRIMANENDESWETSPKVIDETVRVAYEYLEKFFCLEEKIHKNAGRPTQIFKKLPIPEHIDKDPENGFRKSIIAKQISNWLGGNWNEEKVYYALERLNLIEEGVLDKKAIEKLPFDTVARRFARAVKKVKNISPEQQRRAVEKIIETQDFGEESIELAVLEEKHGFQRRRKEEEKRFEEFLRDCRRKTDSLIQDFQTIIDFKKDFDSDFYNQTFEKWDLIESIDRLIFWAKKIIGGESNEKRKEAKQALPEHLQ